MLICYCSHPTSIHIIANIKGVNLYCTDCAVQDCVYCWTPVADWLCFKSDQIRSTILLMKINTNNGHSIWWFIYITLNTIDSATSKCHQICQNRTIFLVNFMIMLLLHNFVVNQKTIKILLYRENGIIITDNWVKLSYRCHKNDMFSNCTLLPSNFLYW